MGNAILAAQMLTQLLATASKISTTLGNLKPGEDLTDDQLKALAAETDAAFDKIFGPPQP